MTLQNKVKQFSDDADIAHQIVHGDATKVVITGGGPVRSIAKLLADEQARIQAQAPALADLAASDGAAKVGFVDTEPGATPTTVLALLRGFLSSAGSSLLGFIQAGVGAFRRSIQDRLRETISVFDFMTEAQIKDVKAGTALLDVTAAIQAALNYAGMFSVADEVIPGAAYVIKGGTLVYMPPGTYLVSNTLTIPQNVGLRGAGKHSSVIKSSYNGQILRNNGTPTVGGTYDCSGLSLLDFSVIGDRTQPLQVGIDLLRPYEMKLSNVGVSKCGGHGVIFRQGLLCEVNGLSSVYNVGDGLVVTSGINSWGDPTANVWPSNANTFSDYHGLQNDGAGKRITGRAAGNIFIGGACEYNYHSSGANAGYNIVVENGGVVPNQLIGPWTEGPAKAHIYVNFPEVSSVLQIRNWKHFGNGSAGNVDRALIVDSGIADVDGAFGHADSYKTIAGSNAPFRVNKAGPGVIYANNCVGSNVTPTTLVEDETGAVTGLANHLKLSTRNVLVHGAKIYADSGQIPFAIQNIGALHPWIQWKNFGNRGFGLGDGTAAPDVYVERKSAGVIGLEAGDALQLASAWDTTQLRLGSYYLWVTSTGVLRIKAGAPISETDGTVVGAQT